MSKKYVTNSAEETQNIAKDIAKNFSETGGIIALSGELGAGKTTFVQGFAQALGIKDKIISPTFVLVRQHPIPQKKLTLFHIDLYRLENPKDFDSIGLSDLLTGNDIVLVEWSEKYQDWPKGTTFINLKATSDSQREITIE